MDKVPTAFFERVQGKLHPVTIDHYYGPRLERSRSSLPCLAEVLKAHLVMVVRCGIVPGAAARDLLRVLQRVQAGDPAGFPLDPAYEDLYINLERFLTAELGTELAGYLPVARSRNDLEATMWRMEIREDLARITHSLLALVEVIAGRSADVSEYLMPGYTYGQQAQPLTLGHYLTAVSANLLRDAGRLLDCTGRLNRSPLGAAALAGTGFAIDRSLTSRLLGFEGLAENTLDAVATADFLLEAAAAAAIGACTLARLAEDVFRWCSNEVGFASLPDDLIDASTIMPQKRNPVIVASVRALARQVSGRLAGLLACCSVGFEASRDVTVAEGEVRDCLSLVYGMAEITLAFASRIEFKREVMERALEIGFSNATEVADTLVREGGMPFRIAHQVVGAAVADLHGRDRKPVEMDRAVLDRWCREITGKPLPLTDAAVRDALDHRVCVERRGGPGGPSPAEVRRMAADHRREAARLRERVHSFEGCWQSATRELDQAVQELLAGMPGNPGEG